jgi:hypothetical protein
MRDVNYVPPPGPPPRRLEERRRPRKSRRGGETPRPDPTAPGDLSPTPSSIPEGEDRAGHIDLRV